MPLNMKSQLVEQVRGQLTETVFYGYDGFRISGFVPLAIGPSLLICEKQDWRPP